MPVKERNALYKSLGLCPNCGDENLSDTVWCDKCLEKRRQKHRKKVFYCRRCGAPIKRDGDKKWFVCQSGKCAEERKAEIRANQKKYYEENKEQRKEYSRKWHKENRDNETDQDRKDRRRHQYNVTIKRRYNIDPEEFFKIGESQKWKCAICGIQLDRPESGKKNVCHLDHDHITNKVRGILCKKCNFAIGLFDDNIEVLLSAIEYLEKHS